MSKPNIYNVIATGTTEPRDIRDRFSDVVNVKDFGAVGDGVHDDTEVIQAALDAITNINKTLYFPRGDYKITCNNTLTKSNIAFILKKSLVIFGNNAKIVCDFTNAVFEENYIIFLIRNSDIYIEGIDFVDMSKSAGYYTAIGCGSKYDGETNWDNTKYKNIKVNNCRFDGFTYAVSFKFEDDYNKAGGVSNIRITNCHAERKNTPLDRNGSPFHFACSFIDTEPISDVMVIGCSGSDYKNAATVGFYGVSRAQAIGCSSRNNRTVGLQFENGCRQCLVTNFQSDNDNVGVSIDDSCDVTVDGVAFNSRSDHAASHEGYFAGRLRPAVWITSQGDDNTLNKGRELYGITVSNVVAENGVILTQPYSTQPDNPNVLKSVMLCNISMSCTDKAYTGIDDGIFLSGSSARYVLNNVHCRGFNNSGIMISSAKSVSIHSPVVYENTKSIVNNNASIPVEISGGYLDIEPEGLLSTSELVVGDRRSCNYEFARKIGFYNLSSDINTVLARAGSLLTVVADGVGRAYLKANGTSETTSGWKELVTNSWYKSFIPGTDNSFAIGSSAYRWSQIYAASGSINTSDANEKQDVQDYPDTVLDAWGDVSFRQFLFKDAVEKKGDSARIHAGVIAQQVVEAFSKYNLDATKYGLLCYDEWPDEYETIEIEDSPTILDENGNEIIPAKKHTEQKLITKAGSRYGIRYSEALCIEAAYQRRRADRLEERIKAIEDKLNVE